LLLNYSKCFMLGISSKDFSGLFNFLPYLGAYFILYGAIQMVTYYSQFNIDIVGYVDFSEIIVYFIKDIHLVLVNSLMFIAFPMVLRISGLARMEKEVDEIVNNTNTLKERIQSKNFASKEDIVELRKNSDNAKSQLAKSKKTMYVIITITSLSLLFLFAILIQYQLWYMLARVLVIMIITILVISQLKEQSNFIVFTVLSLVVLIFSSFFDALENASQVKEKAKHKGFEIVLNDSVKLVSDTTSYFIGKTSNYTFFHKDSINIVIPNEQIKTINIPSEKVIIPTMNDPLVEF
jgi:uncharacterized membrane protein (DUF485 family)